MRPSQDLPAAGGSQPGFRSAERQALLTRKPLATGQRPHPMTPVREITCSGTGGGSDRSRAQWYVMVVVRELLPRFGSTVLAADTAATSLTLTPGAPVSVAVTTHEVPFASVDSVHTRPAV
jgi:hypothetical protein